MELVARKNNSGDSGSVIEKRCSSYVSGKLKRSSGDNSSGRRSSGNDEMNTVR